MRVNSSNGQKIIFKYRPEEWPEGINTIKELWKGNGKHNAIQLLGNGSYSLGVGSVHPNGSIYSLAHGSEFNPLTLTKPEIEELVDVIAGDEYNDHSSLSRRLKGHYAGKCVFNDQIIPLGQLDDEIINTMAANAKRYYLEGSKNDFTLGLCGTLRKMGVSYDDVYKLEYRIDPADSKNLNRVKYIFNHKGPLAGKKYLTKVLASQGLNQFQTRDALHELFKPIEGLNREAANQDKQNLIEEASETITKTQRFLTIEESKDILYYNGNGVYLSGGELLIEKEAEQLLGYELSNKHLSEIKGHIMRRTYHKRSEIDADINIINLQNGLYNIETHELRPHSPDYLSINQKPINFNSKAKPELFGKYLHDVLYPAEVRTAVECMAYTFYRDNPFEVITLLFGYGSNGKSVFTETLTALHGTKNISNVSLSAIIKNPFALSDLEVKDVNIDSELSNVTIYDTAILKKLTGRQPIRIERKNQRAYDTNLHAKLWFSANKIPQTADNSDAYYRRMPVISFPHKFEGQNADPDLSKKLTTEEELSGIFNVLMIALRRILHNKGIYLNKKTIQERREKYEIASNPIGSFIEHMVAKDCAEDDKTSKEEFYRAYVLYCKENNLPIQSKENFGKILKRNFGFQEGRESSGLRRPVWKKVRLVVELEEEGQQMEDSGKRRPPMQFN